jgi:hypothetical protein
LDCSVSADSSIFSSEESYGKNNSHLEKEERMSSQKNLLSQELVSLFDLKKSKVRDEKLLTQAAFEAQRDIRYLTLMFCDGIPDVSMKVTDTETIKWDAQAQKLLYMKNGEIQILEAASREVRVKMRPFLADLVRKAKDFYRDN